MPKQFDYQMILDTYRQLEAEANAANESRYQGILGTVNATTEQVGQTYDQIDTLLSDLGSGERERIEMGRTRRQADAEQDLITRGLGNTTIRSSVQRGIDDDSDRSNRELTEQVGRQKAGVLQSRAGVEERMGNFLANMMDRRTDQGPDLGLFSQLAAQVGAGEAGTEKRVLNTGLSANARAGRTASGREFRFQGGGGGSGGGGGGSGVSRFGSGGGGSGGGGGGVQRFGRGGGGSSIRGASSAAAQRLGGGGGPATTGGGGDFASSMLGGGGRITNDPGGTAWSDFMQPGSGFISGAGGTTTINQEDGIEQVSQAAAQEEEEQMQKFYRPGILGWQGNNRGREFASAGAARAAGYGYIKQGGEFVGT